MSQQEMLFEIIASEAEECFFIRDAEVPAIIISGKYAVGHMPKKRGDKYTVWFANGMERWSFKSLAEAETRAWEIIAKMKAPAYGKISYRRGKETWTFEEKLD